MQISTKNVRFLLCVAPADVSIPILPSETKVDMRKCRHPERRGSEMNERFSNPQFLDVRWNSKKE
jgi:hypothetical protein